MRRFYILALSLSFLAPFVSHAQTVDLIWQGGGYVPPFYKGLNLWGQQSLLKIVAVPQGLGNPANLNYRWSRNGTVLGSLSGIGKNSYTYLDDVLSRTQQIMVEIVTSGGDTLASKSITLTPRSGEALVYESNPLYGTLYNREVGANYQMKEAEVSFTATPYFFSGTKKTDPKFIYNWQTNNGGSTGLNSVTFRVPEGGSGQSQISVNITRSDRLIQDASKNFLVQFGQ